MQLSIFLLMLCSSAVVRGKIDSLPLDELMACLPPHVENSLRNVLNSISNYSNDVKILLSEAALRTIYSQLRTGDSVCAASAEALLTLKRKYEQLKRKKGKSFSVTPSSELNFYNSVNVDGRVYRDSCQRSHDFLSSSDRKKYDGMLSDAPKCMHAIYRQNRNERIVNMQLLLEADKKERQKASISK